MMLVRRIIAIQHCATLDGLKHTRVMLDAPPVAVVSDVESIMAHWWFRTGGYPIGRLFGTFIQT